MSSEEPDLNNGDGGGDGDGDGDGDNTGDDNLPNGGRPVFENTAFPPGDPRRFDINYDPRMAQLLQRLNEIPENPRDPMVDLADALNALANKPDPLEPPKFSGKTGEEPFQHTLIATDWMKQMNYRDTGIVRKRYMKFALTLEGKAREWYEDTDIPRDYDELCQKFIKRFSVEGKSLKNLHEKWRDLRFNPDTDNIEKFVRKVKSLAKHLGYQEVAVVNTIKSAMPTDVYRALYSVEDLPTVVAMVEDLFEAKAGQTASTSVAGATGTTPFNAAVADKDKEKLGFKATDTLESKIDQLCATFDKMDSKKGPWKPYLTRGRGKGKGNNDRSKSAPQGRQNNQNRNSNNRNWGQNKGRGQKFDKSPNQRRPRSSSRPVDRDSMRCFYCNEEGHFIRDCPQKRRDEATGATGNSSYNQGQYNQGYRQNNAPNYQGYQGYGQNQGQRYGQGFNQATEVNPDQLANQVAYRIQNQLGLTPENLNM